MSDRARARARGSGWDSYTYTYTCTCTCTMIGAETPDEIAVAIAAELVACRGLGAPRVGEWTPRRRAERSDER
ncbi:MAG: hypothetical protein HOV81_00275 [Kofleriaceae bacterium]|nr:hypothetical protein [Kofleriaceae bacterium]